MILNPRSENRATDRQNKPLQIIDGGRPANLSSLLTTQIKILFGRFSDLLSVCWNAETEQHILWLPVPFALGIACYFALPYEPEIWIIAAVFSVSLFATIYIFQSLGTHDKPQINLVSLGVLTLFLLSTGFLVAQSRSLMVAAPMLDEAHKPTDISGRIQAIDKGPTQSRLVLNPVRIPNQNLTEKLESVRISFRRPESLNGLTVGDWVQLRAGLLPPPNPAMPGAFNFRRRAFFQKLGAIGYSADRNPPKRIRPFVPNSLSDHLTLTIERLRDQIAARLYDGLTGQASALAIALVIGDRQGLTDQTQQAMRGSGLAHLLAISGLHVGMMAGLIFFVTRFAFAAIPPLALRWPIKKWAAITAMIAAFFYLQLAGNTVPTQRAFLMIAIALVAILFDRSPISMRMVVISAFLILLIRPEALVGASFQMSFAAVIALITAFEQLRQPWQNWIQKTGINRRLVLYLASVILSSLVAGIATAPFSLFHFSQMASYGLLANLLAIPLMALILMPLILLSLLLMGVGLDYLALYFLQPGLDALLALATNIAQWPGAVIYSAAFDIYALSAIAFGGLWLALWRKRWRLWGFLGIGIGCGLAFIKPVPDLLIARDGKRVGLRVEDRLYLSGSRRRDFTAQLWQRRLGVKKIASWPKKTGEAMTDQDLVIRCDSQGCLATLRGHVIAIPQAPAALEKDCRHASLLIAHFAVTLPCPAPEQIIDARDIARGGAYAVWLRTTGPQSIAARIGCRPWMLYAVRNCIP